MYRNSQTCTEMGKVHTDCVIDVIACIKCVGLGVGMFCLSDFEANAQKVLGRNAWDYYSSGANQEQTLRDNTKAFQRCMVS